MTPKKIQRKDYAAFLKKRPRDAHKGLFGHVLVVGGDSGYGGAVRMAAEAALRVGAGLVSIATHPMHANYLTLTRPEIMCHGVSHLKEWKKLVEKATVIVAGPGLGVSSWSKKIFEWVLRSSKSRVFDADALNLLSQNPSFRSDWILTPHPGEAARLLKTTTAKIAANRGQAALNLQKKWGGVIVLKGQGTLVQGADLKICPAGNPGMATAGMGDVLSGVIGGLLAQHLPEIAAAECGVFLHALAGDLAAKSGERGMLACDLFPFLRRLVNV